MYFTGITIAIMTFLTIGIWHPVVIKTVRPEKTRGERLVSQEPPPQVLSPFVYEEKLEALLFSPQDEHHRAIMRAR